MNKLRIIVAAVLLIIVAVSGYFIFTYIKGNSVVPDNQEQQSQISKNQPNVPETKTNTNNGSEEGRADVSVQQQPISSDGTDSGCKIGGCSNQLCFDANGEETVSTCIWKEEYSCYSQAKCEKQTDGKCGWTKTEAFKQCLAKINPSL